MCYICVQIMNEKMNLNEAKIALEELLMDDSEDDKHYKELYLGVIGDILEDKTFFSYFDESHKKDGIK